MTDILEFLAGMFGSRLIEVNATILGLINVALIVRRSIWTYPFGIAMVSIYAWIFFEAQLYSQALLQIYFLVVQLIGVLWWLDGRAEDGLVTPRNLQPRMLLFTAVIVLAGTFVLGTAMGRLTDAVVSYWDALVAMLSMAAQFLMARRFLQSWILWIVVDVVAIGLYWTQGLVPTAVLYCVFLALAVSGYRAWRISMPEIKVISR